MKPERTPQQSSAETRGRATAQGGSFRDPGRSQALSGGGDGGQRARHISRAIPLRQEVFEQVRDRWRECHPGLAYAKFPNTWELFNDERTGQSSSFHIDGPKKKTFFEEMVKLMEAHQTGSANGKVLFEQFLTRRCRMFETLRQAGWRVASIPLTTDWRLISGLGIAHPFETGFVFDRTYGVPCLPGSSVKGAARAWTQEAATLTDDQRRVIFGPDEQEEKRRKRRFVPAQGHAVFFDAYPTGWPALELDILNPHYKKYYEDKTTPPADWLSPEPTYFLTVKAGTKWDFVVGVPPLDCPSEATVCQMVSVLKCADTREVTIQQELESKAKEAVEGAATELGLGGKTAVGYGYFRP